ncbi:MAG: phosphoesterase RecJ domain-containing protein, partial [Ruminococcaceae bacterium]|nr:phosphoesterase RecJ domain-containing protein [Oscillospiraceae bacterium]
MLTVAETAALLRTFDNVLILTHIRPDGDTVGCAAALCAALRALGKTAYLLPNPGLTDSTAPYFLPYAAPEGFAADKVVSTDIAATGLFPENAKPYIGRVDLAIDHHPSFEQFGRENIVRPEAAACGELMYDILTELGPITAEIALPLYVAVSTDTGCFAYANTTARTHAVAAELLTCGIDYKTVNKVFFRTKTRKRLALEAD